ncbi:MAG: glycosyltransferase family 4 protein [Methanomicrobiales archaeon]|nr:glycosyltransferase family 4 protein [Methanomicrobiales archaeon]
MRIALLYDCVYPFTIGGVERRVQELGRRLAERGHEVHHFGMRFGNGPAVLDRDGVRIHGVSPSSALYTDGRRAVLPAVRYAAATLRPLLAGGFDLIDAQQFPYLHCFPAAIAARLRRIPLVVTWHEVWGSSWREYLGWPGGRIGEACERAVSRLSAPVAAVSRTTEEQLRSLGVRREIAILPNGVDSRAIAAVPPAPGSWDLLSAGRQIPEKRHDHHIGAVPGQLPEHPSLSVLIAGDGPERPALERLASRLGVSGHISFSGFSQDPGTVIGLMKSARVYVSPSVREGFGMAALEAMACGIPVVTVDNPRNAVRERVTPSTGRIARPTPGDLAEKIRECLENPSRFREGCLAMAAGYDWEAIVPRVEDFYLKAVAG